MKKSLISTILIVFYLVSITSCSDDNNEDNVPKTNVKGKPSSFVGVDWKTSLFYNENKIITKKNAYNNQNSYSNFEYKEGNLYTINSGLVDSNIADGHSSKIFERDGNKITVSLWAEPSSVTYRSEIFLDDNGVPTKLVELGAFKYDEKGELVKERDGIYYSEFIYDSSDKKLQEQSVYKISDATLVSTYKYEYDDKPGVFSKVDLPLWYIVYNVFNRASYSFANEFYLNNVNNLSSVTIIDNNSKSEIEKRYTYQYDVDNYPISVSNDTIDEGDSVTIEY